MKKTLILCSLCLLLFISGCAAGPERTLKYRVPPVDYEQQTPVYK